MRSQETERPDSLGIKMSNDQELEPEGENLLRAGKKHINHMSALPAIYSIAISLKRIADALTDKDHIKKFGK